MSTKNVNAENDTEAPTDAAESPVRLPNGWNYRLEDGRDVFEHDETGLRVRIWKRYGQSTRHDDYKWHATIRHGEDGVGEPLTWDGDNSRDSLYAVTAKFAAGTPDGEYDPADHEPDGAWEWERPRWPAVLGYDDEFANIHDWRAD